jgi:hypothetical protein
MKLIKRIILTSSQASIVYTIPSGYDDILIKISARSTTTTASATRINLNFSNVTTNYYYRKLELNGSTGTSTVSTAYTVHAGHMTNASYTSNVFSNSEIYLCNITQDELRAYQTVLADGTAPNNSTTDNALSFSASSNNTAYLNKPYFTLTPELGSFAVGTTVAIYGIQNYSTKYASSFKATGGDIYYFNGYAYHFFYENTNFIPNQNITGLNYLIVGGGGGGDFGNDNGRRGGNGGQVQTGTTNVTSGTTYPIVVGAGGYGWTSQPANPGNPSSAFGVTATGGLAEQNISGNGAAGTYVANFSAFGESGYFGGQGGTGNTSGGTPIYSGGLGGGGKGAGSGVVNGISGWDFTGGGGGGGNDASNASGSGGKGVVIVRYTI